MTGECVKRRMAGYYFAYFYIEKYHYKDKERKKRTRKTKMREEEDVKRKNFLERNRIGIKKKGRKKEIPQLNFVC